jgi:hypothetical protein
MQRLDPPRRRFGVRFPVLALVLAAGRAAAVTADFEDVGAVLAPNTFVNDSLGFTSRGVGFNNQLQDFGGGFASWAGFSYSNVQDSVTPGYGNQYAAYRASDPGAAGAYGVGFVDSFLPLAPRITFANDVQIVSVKVANTTYTALSMRDGDAFAKKFGGASGHDPDFFLLTIEGFDAASVSTGSLEVFLADYRFSNDPLDYILADFTPVDLTSLGTVRGLAFTLSSSDVGAFGMNTPAYFALDDVVAVPEPSTAFALGVGLTTLAAWRRRYRAPAAV